MMKATLAKVTSTSAAALMFASSAMAPNALAQDNVVNVYNWSDYIAEDTLASFKAETGIEVNYDVFDSNEVLEAKLLTGSSGYDLVVPSMHFMARQIQAGVFAPIDKATLSNYGNLDPEAMAILAVNDPDNTYGVPYMIATTGIGYNVEAVAERIDEEHIGSWAMVFEPEIASKLADCGIAMLDSPTDVIPPAMLYLGIEPTSEDKGDLDTVTNRLLEVRPHVRYFHSSQYINDLANGDICVAIGWSGDVYQASDRAAEAGQEFNVAYAIPKEGGEITFDMLAIPADAPNPENAHKLIDYLLRPEVAAGITNYVFYANPNTAAAEFVDTSILSDPGIYPTPEVAANLFALTPRSARYTRSLTRAWTTIKTGQ